jgi:DNA-binding CsgD family transcriptional regulator
MFHVPFSLQALHGRGGFATRYGKPPLIRGFSRQMFRVNPGGRPDCNCAVVNPVSPIALPPLAHADFAPACGGILIGIGKDSGILVLVFVGGTVASLVFQNQVTGKGRALVVRQDPAQLPLYFGHFASRNPLLRITDMPARPRVMTDEEKLPKEELVRTEYYNEFLRPNGMHSLLMARVAIEESNTVVLNVGRPLRREPFGAREIEIANRLYPQLMRAVRLAQRLTGIRELDGGLKDVVDRASHGAFLLNGDCKVRYINRAGEALAAGGRGITLSGGMLRGSNEAITRRLHALIAAACADDGERRGGAMALPRPDHRLPLAAIVSPVRSERLSIFCEGPSVLVFISDPETRMIVSEQRVRDLFGLSRAEARVALQMLEGCDPREVAQRLGVSFYTVRAHLVRVFEKTGTNRQAELVGLLMRAIGQAQE